VDQLKCGLGILKSPAGRHLITALLVRARIIYSRMREDMRRRKKENDTTPGFTELDLWQCKEYLFSSEQIEIDADKSRTAESLPPQYRGKIGLDFTKCSLTLFSRKHLVSELLDIVKTAARINVTAEQFASLRELGKKKVRIRDLQKVFIPKPRRRRHQKKAEETDNKDPAKAALALISVIEDRIKTLRRNAIEENSED
jgi:hypothetical protein